MTRHTSKELTRLNAMRQAILVGACAALFMPGGLLMAQSASPAPATPTNVAPTTAPSSGAAPAAVPTTHVNGISHITTQPGGGLLINFKDVSIDSVLDELSSVAGFIVVKVDNPVGRVTMVSKQPVTAADAVSLLNTVLKTLGANGYAAIQQGRILKIMSRDRARTSNIPVHTGSDPSKIAETDEMITQVIPLRSVDAMQLKNDLAPLIDPSQTGFTANASSNSLVITDTSANIHRIAEIVSAMDASQAGSAEVKVFQLQYASASSAAKLVNDLFGDQAQANSRGSSQSSRFGGFSRFFGGGGGPPGFGGFGGSSDRGGRREGGANGQNGESREQIKTNASSDDRTNTVVVVGPPDTIKTIEKVLHDLDANPAAESSVFIYHMKNGQALDVQDVVNYVFNSTPGSGGSPTRSGGGSNNRSGSNSNNRSSSSGRGGSSSGSFGSSSSITRSGFGNSSGYGGSSYGGFGGLSSSAQQTASQLAGEVSVIAEPDTNSLLVRTSPKNYDSVKAILDELDRPVPQVLIKVLVAEVTHDDGLDLGVELSGMNMRASGNGTAGVVDFGLAAAQATNGGFIGTIKETNFTAVLHALQTVGKLDVLSRPYILASDNQLASIIVGQTVPIPTDSRVTDTGQTISSIQYQNIGIILNVTPHINPDGLVILDVNPEISSLSGQSVPTGPGQSAPIFNTRSADSRVGIIDGRTIVIGGLMEDRTTQTLSKVPLLGDIPGLGLLFQHNVTSKSKTELLIFLTPHVASRPDMLSPMSQDELKGTKLTPNAVAPGVFDEHMRGMKRGEATTRPSDMSKSPAETTGVRVGGIPDAPKQGTDSGPRPDYDAAQPQPPAPPPQPPQE